jgi:hypothetical protein
MFVECRQIQSSGQKCKSPAVRNTSFCFFHGNVRKLADAPPPPQDTPFVLPFIEDSRGILLAVNQTFQAMGQGRIKRSEAGTYLYGIQIAAKVIARIEQTVWEPVRALEYDEHGAALGEQKTGCDPFLDCISCDRQDICELRQAALEKNPDDLLLRMRASR